MRIGIAQLSPTVGDFEGNVAFIQEAYQKATAQKADVLITPELSLCGYPPHDLVYQPEMMERTEGALKDLLKLTAKSSCALIVGHVGVNPKTIGRPFTNSLSVLFQGKSVFTQPKMLLPTYDVFDETRYFEPGTQLQAWEFGGKRLGFCICEDLWAEDAVFGRKIYEKDPVDLQKKQKIDLLLALSASPFEMDKRVHREQLHQNVAARLGVPLIYVNQVGATDEILFDGGSFVLDAKGRLLKRFPLFEPAFEVVDTEHLENSPVKEEGPLEMQTLYRGLTLGIREYFKKTGFKKAILGLSGGIDSSLVALLLVRALGAEQVLGVAMPGPYNPLESLQDAEALAKNLKIRFEVRSIKFLHSVFSKELTTYGIKVLESLALENLQARIRGMLLMTLSNHFGRALVLSTGNKSELAMGFSTLYGDLAGALAPIGDLYKTQVYALARYANDLEKMPIPDRCFTKAPSAELRPDQTDQQTLPPYEVLDPLLFDYIENKCSVADLEKRYEKQLREQGKYSVQETVRRFEQNEYKRRQAPPVLKISSEAFGIGRRVPIAKVWNF